MRISKKNWMMSLALSSQFLFGAYASALTVVSDIDDTIKISHVNDIPSLIVHVPLLHAFTGMSTLYRGLKRSGSGDHFFYLSGSPTLLNGHLEKFISHNDFPDGELRLRKSSEPRKVGLYKLQVLKDYLGSGTQDNVILIGDDTEADADTYAQIKKEFPGRVLEIFIHRVSGNPLSDTAILAGAKTFLSSLDLAILMNKYGLLNDQGLIDTANSITADEDKKLIVAPFQKCPVPYVTVELLDPNLEAFIQNAAGKIENICHHHK